MPSLLPHDLCHGRSSSHRLLAQFRKETSLPSSVQLPSHVSLPPHGLQHARPPCLLPNPRVYSNSCPSSQCCHPTISSSVTCGEQAPPLAKVMRKEAWHTQRWDQASGVSLEILEQSTPKTRVCLLSALCTYTSDFTGGCPPLPL